eukprot:jgi/Mesvir1/10981/Mv22422-RA.1
MTTKRVPIDLLDNDHEAHTQTAPVIRGAHLDGVEIVDDDDLDIADPGPAKPEIRIPVNMDRIVEDAVSPAGSLTDAVVRVIEDDGESVTGSLVGADIDNVKTVQVAGEKKRGRRGGKGKKDDPTKVVLDL